jgi:PST family polysaccharide transporter
MKSLDTIWQKYTPRFIRRRLEGRVELQKVIANTGWLIVEKFIQLTINLFVGIWVARYLGPELRGIIIYANSFVSLVVPLSALGLGGIVIREIVKDPHSKYELIGTVFVLQVMSYLLILPLIIAAVLLLRSGEATVVWAVIIIAIGNIFSTSRIFDFWFQSQLKSKYVVWATQSSEIVIAVVKIILILADAPLMAFVIVTAINMVLYFLAKLAFYIGRGEKIQNWRFSYNRAKAMLQDSWPLAFSFLAITIYTQIDNVMLGQLMDNHAVGIFGEAARISTMWYFIPAAIASSAYPVLVRSYQNLSPRKYQNRTQTLFDILSLTAYFSSVSLALSASILITSLYGQEYIKSGSVLAVHVWTFIFVSLRHGVDRWLMVNNMTQFTMWYTLLGVTMNIALNYWWIPISGEIGAAWATVLANAISIYLINLFLPQLRPLFKQLVLALFAPVRLPITFFKRLSLQNSIW